MSRAERGFTLMEVMVTVTLGVAIVGGLSALNTRQFIMESAVRDHFGAAEYKSETGMTAMKLAHRLSRADRVMILSEDPGHLYYRVFVPRQDNPPSCPVGRCTSAGAAPAACCLDIAANYEWHELRYDGARRKLIWYPGNVTPRCSKAVAMGGYLTTATFRYQDTASLPPPGGEADPGTFPASPADTNMLAYGLRWDNGKGLTRDFNGVVALQAAPYSDVLAGAAGPADSGLGLDAMDVAPPPGAPCP